MWWFKRIYTCIWLYPKVDTFFYLKGVLHSVVSSFYFFVFVLIYPRNVDIINRPVRMGDSGWASQPFGGLESPLSQSPLCAVALSNHQWLVAWLTCRTSSPAEQADGGNSRSTVERHVLFSFFFTYKTDTRRAGGKVGFVFHFRLTGLHKNGVIGTLHLTPKGEVSPLRQLLLLLGEMPLWILAFFCGEIVTPVLKEC